MSLRAGDPAIDALEEAYGKLSEAYDLREKAEKMAGGNLTEERRSLGKEYTLDVEDAERTTEADITDCISRISEVMDSVLRCEDDVQDARDASDELAEEMDHDAD